MGRFKGLRWMVGVLALAALGAVLWFATRPPPLTVQGEVSSDRVDISPRVAGRVAKLGADVGDSVDRGTVIAELESPQLVATLIAARAALGVARADLNRINSTRPETIAARRAEFAAAEADVTLNQETFDRKAQLAKIVADIATRVQHLDIAMAATSDDANVLVKLVRDRDLNRTISTFYGSERAREIRSSLDPQCLSGFRKNEKYEIEHSDVILTVDNGDFVFLDCAYEELLQSLGPINDTASVPWTMFNDSVSMGYFDVYDQYILNLLYDPRIKAGMTVQEVKAVLPEVLTDVRAWVRKVNNLAE